MRPEHPLVVLAIEALARRFGVEPADLWAWMDRKRRAPRWFVEAAVEAFHPGLRPEDFEIDEALTSRSQNSTLGTMHSQELDQATRGRPMKYTDHPLIAALKEHGVTMAEEAASVKRSRASLRSFVLDASDPLYRPVPEKLAKLWAKKYGVPMSAWPRTRD